MNDIDTDTDTDHLARSSDERARLVERAARRTVALRAGRRRFTGLLWKRDLVVTADEALPDDGRDVHATRVDAAAGERRAFTANVVGRDASTDVALLRLVPADGEATGDAPVDGDGGAINDTNVQAFADVASIRPGASVLVVGAGEDGPAVAGGLVASVGPEWRSLRGGRIDARVELDARPPRLAEGAPVLDARGAVLGMAVTGPRRRALLIPGATIARVAEALERDGAIPRGRVGAALRAIELDGGGRGLVVASVEADGPAAHAGLHQGDIVVDVDGRPAGSLRALMSMLGPGSVGSVLELAVRRGGEDRPIEVTVAERPAD